MIREGDMVILKNREGIVKRINWSGMAEVEWENNTIEMCKLEDLKVFHFYYEMYLAMLDACPELIHFTFEEEKPLKISFWLRIKRAWSVLIGKSVAISIRRNKNVRI